MSFRESPKNRWTTHFHFKIGSSVKIKNSESKKPPRQNTTSIWLLHHISLENDSIYWKIFTYAQVFAPYKLNPILVSLFLFNPDFIQNQLWSFIMCMYHIDDTSTLTRWAPILKLLSNHDLSHTAAWAGQEANGRPKQLYGTNHG